tara:strand:+ start:1188 stop:1850 length:663 start_codon:yes stop_codon:yes gene_type:complete
MKRDYFLFIRISKEEYIDSLQKIGQIYCNTIRYFREIENDGQKADENEGKAFIKQVKNIVIKDRERILAKADSAQLYYDNSKDIGNIYCLYGVESSLMNKNIFSEQMVKINRDSYGLGQYALIIHHPTEFMKRVSQKLKTLNKQFNFSPVKYYDKDAYNGELSPFYKSKEFAHQSEIRIWIPSQIEQVYEFQIGDISDISTKITVDKLDSISVQYLKPNT